MSFLESISVKINPHNIDMLKVSYGTPVSDNINDLLAILGAVKAEPQYKDTFVCRAMSTPNNPVFLDVKVERMIIVDCINVYLNKRRKQKSRNYFLVEKDLKKHEVETLARAALYSQIENVKKTEKYYYDMIGCTRTIFKNKYANTLELFCNHIDSELHKIEMQAQNMRFSI